VIHQQLSLELNTCTQVALVYAIGLLFELTTTLAINTGISFRPTEVPARKSAISDFTTAQDGELREHVAQQ
jgi:hypothetical protein